MTLWVLRTSRRSTFVKLGLQRFVRLDFSAAVTANLALPAEVQVQRRNTIMAAPFPETLTSGMMGGFGSEEPAQVCNEIADACAKPFRFSGIATDIEDFCRRGWLDLPGFPGDDVNAVALLRKVSVIINGHLKKGSYLVWAVPRHGRSPLTVRYGHSAISDWECK